MSGSGTLRRRHKREVARRKAGQSEKSTLLVENRPGVDLMASIFSQGAAMRQTHFKQRMDKAQLRAAPVASINKYSSRGR